MAKRPAKPMIEAEFGRPEPVVPPPEPKPEPAPTETPPARKVRKQQDQE